MADSFPLATAADNQPLSVSFYSTQRDIADYLPAPAADRLRVLRQRVSDKNALLVGFETRHAAHTKWKAKPA